MQANRTTVALLAVLALAGTWSASGLAAESAAAPSGEAASEEAAALPTIQLSGMSFTTRKHQFKLAPSGLPEQIVIRPAPAELPLESRGKSLPDVELAKLGRGPQLRAPLRLVARVAGKQVEAKVRKPARPKLEEGNVVCQSELAVGPVAARLNVRYEPGGIMSVGLGYAGRGEVDALELLVELTGPVDMAIPGPAVPEKVQAQPAEHYQLPIRPDSTIWGNAPADCRDGGRPAPGLLGQLYVGNGDRGFTWITDGKDNGWAIDPGTSMALLETDEAGRVSWRMRLINRTTRLGGSKAVRFSLLVHPATDRSGAARRRQWLAWPEGDAKAVPTTWESRAALRADLGLLRADVAAVLEASATGAVLEGPAGGAALSASQDNAATYPLGLFRYLACTHTGLPARVVPRSFARPGARRSPERIVLGRVLLHDVGVDLSALVDLAGAARFVGALEEFGYFEGDVEFIPYWRSGPLVRFGEAPEADEAFATAEQRDAGGTYVSVYRRPWDDGRRKGRHVMFVIVNERDEPARQRLQLLDPEKLLGGSLHITLGDVIRAYELAGVPDDSDWRREKLLRARATRNKALRDLEDQGAVLIAEAAPGQTSHIFGPVFVPAHDFRILYVSAVGK